MTAVHFHKGQRVAIDGATYKMYRRNEGAVVFENTTSLNLKVFSDDEIERHIEAGTIARSAPEDEIRNGPDPRMTDFTEQREDLQEAARRRETYVKAALERGLPKSQARLGKMIAEIAGQTKDEDPPSPASVCRWIRLWEENYGDIRALIPRFKGRGNKGQRFLDLVEEIIYDRLEYDYKTQMRPTAYSVWRSIDAEIINENDRRPLNDQLKRVSLRTIHRRIKLIDKDELTRARYGDRVADQKYKSVFGGPRATHAMEVIEIDHTRANNIVVHDDTGKVLGRPWITAAICRHTRMIVGLHISFDHPGLSAVSTCLRNVVLPKSYISKKYGISGKWPCHGVPRALVTDNGPEFHSGGLLDSCDQLGIEVIFCPVKKPRYKGRVERFFGTLATQYMNQLPGTTRSSIVDRGDYDPTKNAFIGFETFVRALYFWVVEIYQQNYHRGLRDVPLSMWERSTKEFPVRPVLDLNDVVSLLGGYKKRMARRTGIELEGLFYNSIELGVMRTQPAFDEKSTVKVRFDPSDIGQVWVFDPVRKRYLLVPAVESWYAAGRTMFQHRLSRKHALREIKKNNPTLLDLSRNHDKLNQMILEEFRKAQSRGMNVRAARHMNLGNEQFTEELARHTAAEFMGQLPESLKGASENVPRATAVATDQQANADSQKSLFGPSEAADSEEALPDPSSVGIRFSRGIINKQGDESK